jgi:hypothetical protein
MEGTHETSIELMAPAREGALVVRSPGWLLLTGGLRLVGGMILDVAPRRRSPLVSLTLRGGKRIPLCGWGWPSTARRGQMASLLRDARPGAGVAT